MATYEIDEGRLVVPDGWHDRSANTLDYEGRSGPLRVIMSRHAHRDRQLGAIVDEVLTDMGRRMAGFELISREEILLDAEPAVQVHLRFKDGNESYEQRSLWFFVMHKCCTLGVLSSPKTATEGEALFEQVRGSVRRRPREDESSPLEAGAPFGQSRAY